MNEEIAINLSIKPTWSIVRDIQAKASEFMQNRNQPEDAIESTIMCVAELIENAIKYGIETPDGRNIECDFMAHDDTIFISVSNSIRDENDLNKLINHIQRIQSSDNVADLYIERLQELMDNPPSGESMLGLYRIAYEGGFKLDYKYVNGVLSVFAEKI